MVRPPKTAPSTDLADDILGYLGVDDLAAGKRKLAGLKLQSAISQEEEALAGKNGTSDADDEFTKLLSADGFTVVINRTAPHKYKGVETKGPVRRLETPVQWSEITELIENELGGHRYRVLVSSSNGKPLGTRHYTTITKNPILEPEEDPDAEAMPLFPEAENDILDPIERIKHEIELTQYENELEHLKSKSKDSKNGKKDGEMSFSEKMLMVLLTNQQKQAAPAVDSAVEKRLSDMEAENARLRQQAEFDKRLLEMQSASDRRIADLERTILEKQAPQKDSGLEWAKVLMSQKGMDMETMLTLITPLLGNANKSGVDELLETHIKLKELTSSEGGGDKFDKVVDTIDKLGTKIWLNSQKNGKPGMEKPSRDEIRSVLIEVLNGESAVDANPPQQPGALPQNMQVSNQNLPAPDPAQQAQAAPTAEQLHQQAVHRVESVLKFMIQEMAHRPAKKQWPIEAFNHLPEDVRNGLVAAGSDEEVFKSIQPYVTEEFLMELVTAIQTNEQNRDWIWDGLADMRQIHEQMSTQRQSQEVNTAEVAHVGAEPAGPTAAGSNVTPNAGGDDGDAFHDFGADPTGY